MKLYLFITCVPLFLFLKSLIKPLSQWSTTTTTSETRLLSLPLFKDLIFPISNKNPPPKTMSSLKRKASTTITSSKKVESVDDDDENDVVSATLLDLPELALDCILERLPPKSLCSMAGVCASMRERCLSDRLWERHVAQKWAGVAGQAAYREWQWQMATASPDHKKQANNKQKGLFRNIFSIGWPFSSWTTNSNVKPNRTPLRVDSVMAWYLSLETGKFCFPAQVYNRENGHVGFMLSCYDAKISYDPRTDTFQARYPPHGRRAMAVESGVPWERLRAPPVGTPPHDLHISDCLHELSPGDHIEIQWRRNKEFPYGWWYGVVGHLELCDGNEYHCRCHDSDTIVLEFNQYTPGSRWRHTAVNRKDHREEGNEADGFYGGIRKLNDHHEISTWKHLWPAETLD